jgi:hypothetical protein
LANGSRHESPIGRSPSPAEQDQKDAARSAGKKTARKKSWPEKGGVCTASAEEDG